METGEKRLCGQQAVWNYEEENGLLTIQGVGAMEDYTEPEQVPWNTLIQGNKDCGDPKWYHHSGRLCLCRLQ